MNFFSLYPHGGAVSLVWSRRRNTATLPAAVLFAWLALTAGLAHAQATGTIRASTPPVEYTPFEVVVQTSGSYCFDPVFPLFGDVLYAADTLSVVLTHVISPKQRPDDARVCGQQRKFMLPGLPRGRQSIKVDITSYGGSNSTGARVVETLTTSVDVAPFAASASLITFWTGLYSPSMVLGEGGIQLSSGRFTMFANGWDWLEVGSPDTGYTFKAFAFAAEDRLPEALARLYYVRYPTGYPGAFYTVDKAMSLRLAGEWGQPVFETLTAVGRLNQGACPLGMSSVYQAFHPLAISHRWTQSRAVYAALLANGYQGDGPSWCAPALRGE